MSFLKSLLPIAGSVVGNMIAPGIGGQIGGMLGGAAAGGSSGGASQAGTIPTTSTTQHMLDKRMDSMLFGTNGQGGLLSQYQGMLNTPQDPRMQSFGNTSLNYLAGTANDDNQAIRNSALRVMEGTKGRTSLPAYAVGGHINAPSQNSMDLKGSYDSLINGTPGSNPHLTGAIQRGINQSTNAFQDMQRGATQNLMENIMPGIRSNSVLAGQYGGSRQGIAEGRALGDFATGMTQAMGRFGQNNTDAAVSAQAGAYDADRNRQLAATQGLGAQQYGVAHQNAANEMAAQLTNVNNLYDAHKTNAGLDMQGAALGSGLLSGLSGRAYGVGNDMDQRGINQALKVNSLIAPYTNVNGTSTTTGTQPYFQNSAAGALGGGLAGLGMAGQLFGSGGQSSQFGGSSMGGLSDLFGKNSMFSSGSII